MNKSSNASSNSATVCDQKFMALAIQLARKGLYTTSPNPRVGCVLVKDNEIIGQGFHIKAGQGHAEVNAIADAISSTADYRLYPELDAPATPENIMKALGSLTEGR